MADNDRSLSNRNRSGLSNERGVPHNSLSLDAFYQKAKATANRFVIGLKEYFDFLIHGDAEFEGDVEIQGDVSTDGDLTVNSATKQSYNVLEVNGDIGFTQSLNSTSITLDINANRDDAQGASSADSYIRIGRSVTTSSANNGLAILLHKGVSTGNHFLRGTGDSYVCSNNGDFIIGTTSNPTNAKFYLSGYGANTTNYSVGINSASADRYLDIGFGRTGNAFSFIDLVGDTTYTDFGSRFIRNNTGANANTEIKHRGTGELKLNALTSGNINLSTSGLIVSTSVYNNTTASAANVNVDSSGYLRRSTSSIRFKKDIEPMEDACINKILDLNPIFYRPKNETIPEKALWSYYGVIAEEVAEIDPRFVDWEFGEWVEKTKIVKDPKTENEVQEPYQEYIKHPEPIPTGVFYDRLVVPLIGLVKKQDIKIKELETRIQALENK